MSGKRSRDKGARFERAIANQLKPIYPKAVRGVGQTQAGCNGSDVEGTPWWIECKARKVTNIEGAFAQALDAKEQAEDERPVLVITKKDREPKKATLLLSDFIQLIEQKEPESLLGQAVQIKENLTAFASAIEPLSKDHSEDLLFVARKIDAMIKLINNLKRS